MHRSRTGAAVGAACLLVSTAVAAVPGAGPETGPVLARGTAPAAATASAVASAAVSATPSPARPRIRWGACPQQPVPAGMRCGTLTVPLDHSAPAKGTVRIALAEIPANGPRAGRRGSLLLNFGGPGGSGVGDLAAHAKAFAELGERYDLVAFDPRGVGHSAPVSCGGSMEPEPVGSDDPAEALAALRAVVARCERASGPVLPYIGTVHVARDMDLIRQALGEDKLNYLGFSYGTRLGAVYAAQFPRRVGRMALDGVDTLGDPLVEQALVSAQGQQQALDNFLSWCARQPGCVYGTNTRTAKEDVAALVTRLEAAPLVDKGGSVFTGGDAVTAIAIALYSRELWPDLAAALDLAERKRDPRGLLGLGAPADPDQDGAKPPPGLVPADNAVAAMTAVNCADDPDRSADKASPAVVLKRIDGLREQFRQVSPIFGPRQLLTVLACYGRPAGTDFIRRIDRPGAPRMLLVGTRGDPATPYRWTEETAERLGSAVVLDYKGDGHTGYTASPCVRGYVNHFLIDGRLPSGTRSCPADE
ncbi:alpha/beta hydrolase [Streptomyces sp. NPDC127106]|uniref:alpha/beta hydrolase n=1 Tax=Streptomyces sp. NPDC127106 TaxID=3345360 RepID=UPI00363C9CAC